MARMTQKPIKIRPLSPHLQIYRPQMTSVLSIMHRMAGATLALGLLLAVWVLVAAATGPAAYNMVMNCLASAPGQVVLFGFTAALYYHLFNGVRHLIWDTGQLFAIEKAAQAGLLVLLLALIATVLTWAKITGAV